MRSVLGSKHCDSSLPVFGERRSVDAASDRGAASRRDAIASAAMTKPRLAKPMPTRRSSSLGRSVPETAPRRRSAQLRSHSFAASLPIIVETSTGTFVPTTPTSFESPTSPTFQRGLSSCTSPSFLMSSAVALLDGPSLIIYAQSSCLKRSTWRFSGAERSCYDPVRKALSQVVLASVQPRPKAQINLPRPQTTKERSSQE